MQYLFTAVFTKDEDNSLLVSFPDLPGCYAHGQTMKEAVDNAEHVLSLCLFDMEQQGVEVPNARYPAEIFTRQNETTSVIFADTDGYHLRFAQRTVKYEVYVPAWLGEVAQKQGLDLSIAAQNGIKREIGMPSYNPKKGVAPGISPVFTPAAVPIPNPMAPLTEQIQPEVQTPVAPAPLPQSPPPVYIPPGMAQSAAATMAQAPTPTQSVNPNMAATPGMANQAPEAMHTQPMGMTPTAAMPPPAPAEEFVPEAAAPAPIPVVPPMPAPDPNQPFAASVAAPYPDPSFQDPAYPAPGPYDPSMPPPQRRPVRRKKKNKSGLVLVGVMAVAILFALGFLLVSNGMLDNLLGRDNNTAPHHYDFQRPDRPAANTNTEDTDNSTSNSGYQNSPSDYSPAEPDDYDYGFGDDFYYPWDYNGNNSADTTGHDDPYTDDTGELDNGHSDTEDTPPYGLEVPRERNEHIIMLSEYFDNPDVIGRLTIPGTNIDWAVTQTDNNDFYVSHNVQREPANSGWVFLCQGVDLQDQPRMNSTIYGSMYHGVLLSELSRFADPDFFNSGVQIHFLTLYDHHVFEPFAFYTDNGNFAFTDTNYRNWPAWVQNFSTRCLHQTGPAVDGDDRIITLVASSTDSDLRYIIHARLVE